MLLYPQTFSNKQAFTSCIRPSFKCLNWNASTAAHTEFVDCKGAPTVQLHLLNLPHNTHMVEQLAGIVGISSVSRGPSVRTSSNQNPLLLQAPFDQGHSRACAAWATICWTSGNHNPSGIRMRLQDGSPFFWDRERERERGADRTIVASRSIRPRGPPHEGRFGPNPGRAAGVGSQRPISILVEPTIVPYRLGKGSWHPAARARRLYLFCLSSPTSDANPAPSHQIPG